MAKTPVKSYPMPVLSENKIPMSNLVYLLLNTLNNHIHSEKLMQFELLWHNFVLKEFVIKTLDIFLNYAFLFCIVVFMSAAS